MQTLWSIKQCKDLRNLRRVVQLINKIGRKVRNQVNIPVQEMVPNLTIGRTGKM